MKISFKPNNALNNKFIQFGVPQYLWNTKPFELEECVRGYTSSLDGYAPIRISQEKQLEDIGEMYTIGKPYVACISSDLDDTRAKMLGADITEHFISEGGIVRWHCLMGGYYDSLIEDEFHGHLPSLIVVYNISPECDPYRLQKLRDVLETFSSTPIIVLTSNVDPIELFIRLGIQLDYSIRIKTSKRKLIL